MIRVSKPLYGPREWVNGTRAILKGSISGHATPFISQLENSLEKTFQRKFAVSTSSGTTALALAYRAIGISPGDRVAVSSYTNMATFFPLLQLGAIPVPVDIDQRTWNMDVSDLESVLRTGVKALVVVHIFGNPAKMTEITKLSKKYNIPLIEDCAEAHGARHKNKLVGTFGDIACYSFYSNKIISSGEGGAVLTDREDLALSMKSLRNLGFGKQNKFLHDVDGYNFRMSNLHAGIALAQLNKIEKIIFKKRKIAEFYGESFAGLTKVQLPYVDKEDFSVYWMYKIVLQNETSRDTVAGLLAASGCETRPGFIPFSDQTNIHQQYQISVRQTPVASQIGKCSLYLPSGPNISRFEIRRVAKLVKNVILNYSEQK
jgi:perosamine synthetase